VAAHKVMSDRPGANISFPQIGFLGSSTVSSMTSEKSLTCRFDSDDADTQGTLADANQEWLSSRHRSPSGWFRRRHAPYKALCNCVTDMAQDRHSGDSLAAPSQLQTCEALSIPDPVIDETKSSSVSGNL